MDQATAETLQATLTRIETKIDEVLRFRDFVMGFANAGTAKKLAALARAKFGGD